MELQELYRPVGSNELAWIRRSGWTRFPASLIKEPVFFPFIDDACACKPSVRQTHAVTPVACIIRFHVVKDYLKKYPVLHVGADMRSELHVPPDALDDLNNNIIGLIEITGM